MLKPVVFAVVWTAPAFAQTAEDDVTRYGGVLEVCYSAAEDAAAGAGCIGEMSAACMTGNEGGETTLGMSMCLTAERDAWDVHLNAEYRKTMDFAKAGDAEDAENFPGHAVRAETLRSAQRAWIAYRDAECGLAYAMWGAGSMRHIAGSDCLMRMTAERTLELRAMREVMQ